MSYVKANKVSISDAQSDADKLTTLVSQIKTSLETFKSDAESEAAKWESNETYISAYISKLKSSYSSASSAYNNGRSSLVNRSEVKKKNDEGKEVFDHYSYSWNDTSLRTWAIERIKEKKSEFLSNIPSLTMVTEENKAKYVLEKLSKVVEAINTFESSVPSLEDALNTIGTLPEGFSVESIDMMIDGEQVSVSTLVYTDDDGNRYTVSELVNSFYTYLGSTVASDMVLAYSGLSGDELDKALLDNGNETASSVNSMLTKGFFSVASDNGISEMYNDAMGADTYDADKVHNLFVNSVNEVEDVDKISKNLAGLTNASAIGSMALAGLAFGTYKDSVGSVLDSSVELEQSGKKASSKPDGNGTGGGGEKTSYSREGTVVKEPDDFEQPVPEEKVPEDPGDFETQPTPELELVYEEPTKEAVPKEIKESLTDEQIDELAREEFDNQFETEEDYANYLADKYEEFDNLFDSGDVDTLKGKLESYGYNEEEISYLMENKEVCMNAYLSGEQSHALTEIANRIASEHNLDMFDTKYDELPDYQDLTDGDVNTFLTNVNFDKGVVSAKTSYNDAQKLYNDSASKANASIKVANDNKATLDGMIRDFGEDKEKWSQEQAEKYNLAVKAYNESVITAKNDYSQVTISKESMKVARESYLKARNDYLEKIKNENAIGIPEGNENNPLPPNNGTGLSDEDILGSLIFTDTGVIAKEEEK